MSNVQDSTPMAEVTIKVFQSLDDHRELIRTIHVHTESAKVLNGSRALKILHAQFPDLGHIRSLGKTDLGWH
jgi:hypothetical protein